MYTYLFLLKILARVKAGLESSDQYIFTMQHPAAQIATYAGAPDQAIEWLARAISLQPIVPDYYHAHLGLAHFRNGDCPRAVEELEKVSWMYIGYSAPLISCYVEAERLDDAKGQLAKMLGAMPGLSLANVSMYLPFDDQTIVGRIRIHTGLGRL